MTLSLFSNQHIHTVPVAALRYPHAFEDSIPLLDMLCSLLSAYEQKTQHLASILYDIAYLCQEHGDDPEIIPIIAHFAQRSFIEPPCEDLHAVSFPPPS